MGYAPHNRSETVGVFPGCLNALLQFFHTKFCWLKDDVLAVIEFPVFGENSSFGLKPFVKACVWKRRDNRKPRQVNACLDGKFRGFQKHIRLVVIEAKNEAPLKSYPVFVKSF